MKRRYFGRKTRDVVARFEEKFTKRGPNEYWLWQAYLDKDGYGQFWLPPTNERAHRISYELYKGKVPPKHLLVCHSCDNPACVNPSHLFLGTAKDNWHDMLKKGRGVVARGERSGSAKLTWDQVTAIRQVGNKAPLGKTAEEFGVSKMTVSLILRGKRWRSAR